MTQSTRGILTDADRDFLMMKSRGERLEKYSLPAISQRWNTIEKRTHYALGDLKTLYHHLTAENRQGAFEKLEGGLDVENRRDMLQFGAAFLFLGVVEQENNEPDNEDFYEKMFRLVVEKVLMKQGAGTGIPESIDVSVSIEGWDPVDGGLADIDPREHSEDTLKFLLHRGEISSEDFARGILEGQNDE